MNMKATLWLWLSLVTVLVCVSQRVSAGPYTDTRIIQPQDNSLVAPAKRTKPSLSIVNPLDVLRQRIILEMARRQMRENTRQVERNKAILREIGKRSHAAQFRSSDDDDDTVELGGPALMLDRMYYPQPPPRPMGYLRRFGPDYTDTDLDSREQRKSTSSSANKADNSSPNNPNVKPINELGQISGDNSGPLTLAKEQHRLEQEQEAAEKAAALAGRPQELRFANDRLMLGDGSRSGGSFLDEPRDEEDEDEYLAGTEDLIKQRQQNEKLKNASGYRLRYLGNIQAKMYG